MNLLEVLRAIGLAGLFAVVIASILGLVRISRLPAWNFYTITLHALRGTFLVFALVLTFQPENPWLMLVSCLGCAALLHMHHTQQYRGQRTLAASLAGGIILLLGNLWIVAQG